MLRFGLNRLARGLRQANPAQSAIGLALVLIGWSRRRAAPKRRLLYSKSLKPGEELKFRME